MKRIQTYISIVIACVLLTACSHDKHVDDTEPATLYIHVFSPEKPYTTRADAGNVAAKDDESRIHTLQIWVFLAEAYTDGNDKNHPVGELVGYLEPTGDELDKLNEGNGDTFLLTVSNAFAAQTPHVDVYVLANVTEANCGVAITKKENATPAELDAALIEGEYFGTEVAYTSGDNKGEPKTIPDDGLPMSGKLLNQEVYGRHPIYRIGTSSSISVVPLVRMVSKVKFVFSRLKNSKEYVEINKVSIKGTTTVDPIETLPNLPKQEYLFYNPPYDYRNYRVGGGYETGEIVFLSDGLGNRLKDYGSNETYNPSNVHTICESADIYKYRHLTQTGAEYEALIEEGVTLGELTPMGPYYMRETDKLLYGEIEYRVVSNYHLDSDGVVTGEAESQTATFTLEDAGDFSRNHSWIVYAYYHGGGKLELVSTYINDWVTTGATDHEVYNW